MSQTGIPLPHRHAVVVLPQGAVSIVQTRTGWRSIEVGWDDEAGVPVLEENVVEVADVPIEGRSRSFGESLLRLLYLSEVGSDLDYRTDEYLALKREVQEAAELLEWVLEQPSNNHFPGRTEIQRLIRRFQEEWS